MNDDPNTQTVIEDPTLESQEANPLELWAAYQVGTDGKFYYLSRPKGLVLAEGEVGEQQKESPIRIFRTQGAVESYLDKQVEIGRLSAAGRAAVVIHSFQGMIALPEEARPRPPIHIPPIEQLPIKTLAYDMAPTAIEQVEVYEQKRKKRRRR